jgi:hypothetical protein
MSGGRRGGERRRPTLSKRRHRTQARDIVACATGRVLRSVLRPAHVDPHYAPSAQASEVGHLRRHRGWANLRKREEPAPGSSEMNGARLAAHHRSQERRGASEKEGGRGLRPCEDTEPGFGCPHVESRSCRSRQAASWPRISSAYALQKGRQGRVNGGLAFGEGRRVKPSFGTGSEEDVGAPATPDVNGRGPGEDPGWRESAIQRVQHRQKR